MKRLVGTAIAVAGMSVAAAFMVATSGAAVQTPTGDTCTASGSGTAYTLSITLPPNAAQQGGFAFGAPGITVTNIKSSTQGSFSTQNLSPSTTGEWLLAYPAVVGATVTASLTTSGPVTGSFTVVTAQVPPSGSFAPFLCEVSSGVASSNAFTASQQPSYDSANGTWHELVTVSGPGTVRAVQEIAANQVTMPKLLIDSSTVAAKSAGTFALTLRLTGDGKKALAASGLLKLKLSITFSPKDGRAANRVLSLTLRK